MIDDELIMIRVSKSLVQKAIKKLECNPTTPAVYVVDQALREFTKEDCCPKEFFPNVRSEDRD